MKRKFLLAVTMISLVSFAFINRPAGYVVDTSRSILVWTGKKVTGSHTGNISLSSGVLDVDGSELKGGNFEIDLSTITDTDLSDEDSKQKLLGHLKSEDFFGVEKNPKAKLEIVSAVSKGSGNYDVKGNLTIKGITQPVAFPALVVVTGKALTANAKIIVDRTKYGIKFRSKSFFEGLGDKMIYDEFELEVSLVANQK